MENASKALIIAGAILITLIIIGLGVAILGSTEGATDTSTFDAMQVSSYNNKFKPYEGTISGSKLDALFDILIANARAEDDTSLRPDVEFFEQLTKKDGIKVGAVRDSTSVDEYVYLLKQAKEKSSDSERYTVSFDIDKDSDLIYLITIK